MNHTNYGIVALLPMKAHSERVTGKNFKPFAGKPLFSWVLTTLLSIDEIEKVVINTDAVELLASYPECDNPRVQLRSRKKELQGDFTSMNLIIEDDLNNISSDLYLMTHTTNPLLGTNTIKRALSQYKKSATKENADSLFSVNRYQTRFYRLNGEAINHNPDELIRTQDLEPWYEENSNLYMFTKESFAATQARIGQNPVLFETPLIESVDIDNPETWELAELLAYGIQMRTDGAGAGPTSEQIAGTPKIIS